MLSMIFQHKISLGSGTKRLILCSIKMINWTVPHPTPVAIGSIHQPSQPRTENRYRLSDRVARKNTVDSELTDPAFPTTVSLLVPSVMPKDRQLTFSRDKQNSSEQWHRSWSFISFQQQKGVERKLFMRLDEVN